MSTVIQIPEVYYPLFEDKDNIRYTILLGGRGSGKSFASSIYIANKLLEEGNKILYVRYTLKSAKVSIIPEIINKLSLLGVEDMHTVTENKIVNKNTKSEVMFYGIKTSEGTNLFSRLKSIEGINILVLEEAEEIPSEKIFETIDLTIRTKNKENKVVFVFNPTIKSHWIYERFYKNLKKPDFFSGIVDGVKYIYSSFEDLLSLDECPLSDSFLNQIKLLKEKDYKRYEHVVLGKWIDQSEGAVFNFLSINNNRLCDTSNLHWFNYKIKRIAIGIDPATTAGENSDYTGIVVCGVSDDKKYYVIDDLTVKAKPDIWSKIICDLYKKYAARVPVTVIIESNQGGLMAETIIHQIDKNVKVENVRSIKSKIERALPVGNLYEQNKVIHMGTFTKLEEEMITYSKDSNFSPDRLDALVHSLTFLSAGENNQSGIFSLIEKNNNINNKISFVNKGRQL